MMGFSSRMENCLVGLFAHQRVETSLEGKEAGIDWAFPVMALLPTVPYEQETAPGMWFLR